MWRILKGLRATFMVFWFSCVWPFMTLWTAACQVSLSFTICRSLLRLMSIELVMSSISSSVALFSSCFQSFQHQGLFQWVFTSGGQSIVASASVLLMNIQGWFPLGLTCLVSLLSKGLSRVFSSITIWKHQLFCDFFLVHLSYLYVTTGKTIALTIHFCQQSGISAF